MPRPKKRYLSTYDPAIGRLHEGYGQFAIPSPALQGFVRALLSQWSVTDAEKDRLEQLLHPIACSLSDSRLVKLSEEDSSPQKKVTVAKTAAHIVEAIERVSRPCPTEILQVQAQGVDELLKRHVLSKIKQNRNTAHIVLVLSEQLPTIQTAILRSSPCKNSKPHPSSLPDNETLRLWARNPQPAKLRNTILAYYHGITNRNYLAQLLAGRTT